MSIPVARSPTSGLSLLLRKTRPGNAREHADDLLVDTLVELARQTPIDDHGRQFCPLRQHLVGIEDQVRLRLPALENLEKGLSGQW